VKHAMRKPGSFRNRAFFIVGGRYVY